VALAILVVAGAASKVMSDARSSMARQIQVSERLVARERGDALGDSLRAAQRRIGVSASYDVVRIGIEGRGSGLLTAALDQANRSPGVTGGAITDPAGAVLAHAGAAVDLTRSTALRFRSAADRHAAFVTIAAPVQAPDGRVVGWIHQEFDVAGLLPQLASPIPYTDGTASLISRAGRVLLTTSLRTGASVQAPKLRALLAGGRVASGHYHSHALRSDRVGAVAPVPGTDLMVLASADQAAASEPATALVWRLAVALLAMVALLVALAGAAASVLVRSRQALLAEQHAAEVLAATDPLTGLGNRRAFDAAVVEAAGAVGTTAVVLVDLDELKAINDTLGHEGGDEALRLTADALRAAVRPGDEVVRMGGDEFAVLLPDTDLTQAGEVARRIERAIADRPLGGMGPLSASTGAAAGPSAALRDAVKEADTRLYDAKHARRPATSSPQG
jgi:diguanylate cyclase (GGDEF)-like protein